MRQTLRGASGEPSTRCHCLPCLISFLKTPSSQKLVQACSCAASTRNPLLGLKFLIQGLPVNMQAASTPKTLKLPDKDAEA
jgi:hypothetical protein